MLFVASTEKLNPVLLVKLNVNLPPTLAGAFNVEKTGAGILNAELIALNVPQVNVMVAPLIALPLKAARLVYVVTPFLLTMAELPASVHVFWLAVAVMLVATESTSAAESSTVITGCAARTPPSAFGAVGWVVMINCDAAPESTCTIELVL